MAETQDWIMASVGKSWYAIRCHSNGQFSDDVYDPNGVSNMTSRFLIKTPLTEDKAREMVDKLNGPRGQLHRV